MIKGVTSSGFEFELDKNKLANMELVDAIAEAQEGDLLAISRICSLALGKEMRQKLYDFVRAEDGTVPFEPVERELMEMFEIGSAETKN